MGYGMRKRILWWGLLGMMLPMAVTQTMAGSDSAAPIPAVSEKSVPVVAPTNGRPTASAPIWNAPADRYTEFLVDGGAFHVLIADLSGAGRQDLAFTSHSGNAIWVYRQVAPRQFVATDAQDIAGFHPNDTIALPGIPKRYVLNAEGSGELRIAEGKAEGRFSLLAKYPLGNVLSSTPFAWPGWGKISLAIAPYTGTAITLLRDFNPDTAEVKAVQSLPAGHDPRRIQLTDLNKDGIPELVFPSFWDNKIWAVSYAGLDQKPEIRMLASFKKGWPRQVAPLDVNRDGAVDILVPMSTEERIAVLFNDGQGHFQEGSSIPYPGTTGIHTLASGEDREGRYLLAGGSGALVLYRERQDASGSFETVLVPILNWPNWVELADVDGDGWLDAVVASQGSLESRVIYGPLWKAFSQLAEQPNKSKQSDGTSGQVSEEKR